MKTTPLWIKTLNDPRGAEYGLVHEVITTEGRLFATTFSLVDAELIVSLVNEATMPDGDIIKAWQKTKI
jgi:hypothetical protein